jgi:hypothetical protein
MGDELVALLEQAVGERHSGIIAVVRLLMLDHYFTQDIEALQSAGGQEIVLDTMPFEELREESLRVFPSEVATGLEAFTRPELEPARRRYARVLREILEDRFTRSPFDAIVMPSDTFFYVRAAPAVAHALGVPFLVVQKETTISELTMREHAETVRRYAPTLADRMTVCSERHKQFWLRTGADSAQVVVTGQPRFDLYLQPRAESVATGQSSEMPTVLFLSYAVDAYHSDEGRGGSAWELLHRQTEAGLHELARRGWRVLIKPHPQQALEAVRAWRNRAGDLWDRRIFLVDPDADARKLILAADVVVGFQSTALLEAMLAGRPVVYTGWDDRAAAMGGDLIPFSDWGDVITVLRRPDELPDAAASLRGTRCSDSALTRRRTIAEHYLGPLDGGASARVLAVIRSEAADRAQRRGPAENGLRQRLAARRAPLRLSRRSRAGLRKARRQVGAMLGR